MEVFSWIILGITGITGAIWLLSKIPQEKKYYTLKNNIPTSEFINKASKNKKYY